MRRRRQLTRRYRQCLGIGPERCDLQAEILREAAGEDFVAQWLRFTSEPASASPDCWSGRGRPASPCP